jgi:hypothetical protein
MANSDEEALPPPLTDFAPVVINRRMIVWGKDGLPAPATTPLITKPQIEALVSASLSLPYDGDKLGLEPEFDGLTNVEVMMIRMARGAANGDLELAKELLDRVLGKPKQSVESKSLSLSYEDFLNEVARKNEERKSEGEEGLF